MFTHSLNHHYFSLTDDEKSAIRRRLDNEIDNLHDPEKMLEISTPDNDGRKADTELITEVTFIKGSCGNKFCKESKPRIYYFSQESFEKHHGIPSIAAVLQQCLRERQEDDVVILCNNMMEINLAQSALDVMPKASVQYVPDLESTFPTIAQKRKLFDELNSNDNLVLLTDYRSFKGCEASHSIILTDFDKPIGPNIMAEMLSRTMADLDIIVLPKKNPSSYVNPIKKAFDTWQTRRLVQSTTVEFHDEDESVITFKLHDKSMEIEIPDSGFILRQSKKDQNSNKSYL